MKALLLLLLAAGTALAAPTGPPTLAETIRASQWRQRVLLVAAPTATHADYQRQKQLLAAAAAQLHERDVRVLDVLYDQLTPADQHYLRQALGLTLTGFAVVLLGKDGGVKQTSTHVLAPAALFGTIDQMPMRRQEMRRQ